MRDWTGEQIGNYRVLRLLKQEVMIDHYLATDVSSQREVAFDILASPTDEMSIRRFERQAPLVQRLLHPYIAPVFAVGAQDRTPFVVLSHFPTSREAHQFPLPLALVIQYITQLTEALDFLHSKYVVHRSLSPETILIGKQGQALLGGLHLFTLQVSSQERHADPFPVMPTYLAPEQCMGEYVTTWTDQYALALVVYEWLCGTPPFRGDTLVGLAIQHIQAAPPSLREKVPALPLKLEQVVEKALSKKPEERFETMNAFCSALVEAAS